MGQRRTTGPEGELHLRTEWEESSSTHLEHEDTYLLRAGSPTTVVLVRRQERTNFIRSSDSAKTESVMEISVDDLIKLIENRSSSIK